MMRSRDWILLPLISIGVAIAMIAGGELLSRFFWYERLSTACAVRNDGELTFRPNCTQMQKWAETGLIEEKFNDCGYRTAEPCGERLAHQIRGAVLGTSMVLGYMTDYPQSFTARATQSLRHACDRPLDLQNVFVGTDYLIPGTADRLRDLDRLKPDFIVLVLSTFDFTHRLDTGVPEKPASQGASAFSPRGVYDWLEHYIRYRSHLFAILRWMAFKNTDFYMKNHIANEGDYGFMNEPQSPIWRERFLQLDQLIGLVAAKAEALNVPALIMFVPTEVEVRLTKDQTLVKHPDALEDALASASLKYHLPLVPLTSALRRKSNVPDLYYRVDGHPAANAQLVMANTLSESILANVPELASCKPVGETAEAGLSKMR